MISRPGCVTVDLAATIEASNSPELIACINANVKPPEEVSAGDVHIRAMYVVSDEVNSFGGRFPADELENVARLLIDSPVMVGHRKDKLPIARNFHARVEKRRDQLWVKSYFYWLKKADNASDLQENIDGGVYKECSIGFTFHLAECSICSRDIRVCEHEPFKTYLAQNRRKSEPCWFDYRKIDRVLETSLVYRGALPNTSVTKELTAAASVRLKQPKRIESLSELDPETHFLVTPNYEGLLVRIGECEEGQNKRIEMLEEGYAEVDTSRVSSLVSGELLDAVSGRIGQLVGYRGKERMNLDQLERFLKGVSSPVTRIELKLFPEFEEQHSDCLPADRFVKEFRYRFVKGSELKKAIPTLMTRQGVRIWPRDQSPAQGSGYYYVPPESEQIVGKYTLSADDSNGLALFTLDDRSGIQRFRIRGFNLNRMKSGRRFIADLIREDDETHQLRRAALLNGQVHDFCLEKSCFYFNLKGPLSGSYRIIPAQLNGKERLVMNRTDQPSVVGRR